MVYGTGVVLESITRLLQTHGIDIAASIDVERGRTGGDGRRIPGARILEARGSEWISGVKIKRDGGKTESLKCDMLCTAFKGQGAYELPYQAGFDFELSDDDLELNRTLRPTKNTLHVEDGASCYLVGELGGPLTWQDRIASGEEAGRRASESLKTG